jgi:hypothetical protein
MDLKTIMRMIAEGRGQGSGQNYQPFIRTQDFPSTGQRNREFGLTTERQHEYLSGLELCYHYLVDWPKRVIDIQEQFPLFSANKQSPMEETLAIAKQCCIRHPTCRLTKESVPLTVDFLLTIAMPVGVVRVARDVKPSKVLLDRRTFRRTIEKFEIKRRYLKAKGIYWAIVTEREIDLALVDNIKLIHKFYFASALHPLTEDIIFQIACALTEMVQESSAPLCEVAMSCDERLGLEMGRSLTVARHLIATRQWLVDMTKPIHPSQKLELLKAALLGTDTLRRTAVSK